MALLGADGFDVYATADLTDYWQAPGATGIVHSSGGRCDGGFYSQSSIQANGPLVGTTPGDDTGYCGFALLPAGSPATHLLVIQGSRLFPQLLMECNINGSISVWSGPIVAQLGSRLICQSAAGLVTANHWYHFGAEWKCVNDNTGYFKVYLNGVLVASAINVNTASAGIFSGTGFEHWNTLIFSGMGSFLDDVYWGDTTGPAPWNTFLGDLRVQGQVSVIDGVSAGTYRDFTPLTGTDHGAMVDDPVPDDDATYNASAALHATDTYKFPNISLSSGTVYGIQLMPNVLKTDPGNKTIANVIYQGGVLTVGTSQGPSQTNYKYLPQMFQTNPTTSTAWTATTANNMEGGIQVTS